jgi:sulfate adenylyltransferase subunit 1
MSAIDRFPPADTGVLRFSTAGSVDDGKSTLIGRLLYDTKAIFEDQLASIERTSKGRGQSAVDLSLLTDGLLAEREQGITIDVAYRYFATPTRKFIIADTPGHEQYTRNMVTGASTADLAIVLVDARKGLLPQSRRHSYIASLLRIPHVVLAVNKMDLIDYDERGFREIVAAFDAFAKDLGIVRVDAIPLSALRGDMVVERGDRLDWYQGPTLLGLLEAAEVGRGAEAGPLHFPVQWVARPGDSGVDGARAYSGRIESGQVRPGDDVTVLPAGRMSKVLSVRTLDGELRHARAGQSVSIVLSDQIDVSRGDTIATTGHRLTVAREFDATLCWFGDEPFERQRRYLIKHGTRTVKAMFDRPKFRIDVNSLGVEEADTLRLNDIGGIAVRTAQPLAFESYRANAAAGSFVVIDEATHATVAAGLID